MLINMFYVVLVYSESYIALVSKYLFFESDNL